MTYAITGYNMLKNTLDSLVGLVTHGSARISVILSCIFNGAINVENV